MDKFMSDKVYRKIIEFCEEPRSTGEIKDHIGLRVSSTKHRVINLVDSGYIRVIKPFNLSTRGWKYQAVKKHEASNVFKPQGMCILGVWL